MCQSRVAGAEDDVRSELDVQLLPQRSSHVDLGEHPESLLREGIAGPRQGLVEGQGDGGTDAVSGGVLKHMFSRMRSQVEATRHSCVPS